METITQSTISVTSGQSREVILDRLDTALKKHQFGILYSLDLAQTLKDKGQPDVPAFHVLEVCSPSRAYEALSENQRAGYFLPCKLVVFEDINSQNIEIGMQRPTFMIDALKSNDVGLTTLAYDVEQILTEVIIEAARD